jgi:2-polyprenyl-3-methyl-5-hydroxy-6-metoxy-1,4-benzoquinol methylase
MPETPEQIIPLHKLNPQKRFSGRAAEYAKYRPSYPAVAIARIFEGLNEPKTLLAVDIGAGTGISSRLLADRGASVIAIDPNPEMLQAATPHPLSDILPTRSSKITAWDSQLTLKTWCFIGILLNLPRHPA